MALKINKLISKYNSSSRNGNTIKYIVIHYVGSVSSAYNNAKYFSNGDRQASAHFFVGYDGEIWQSVEESRAAWHCGGGLQGSGGHAWHGKCKNVNSIGIEMCVKKSGSKWYFEDATVNATVELTKHLMKKYNVPAGNVIRHYDVTGKICPAPYVNNNTSHTWAKFKSAIGGKTTTTTTSTTTSTKKNYLSKGDKGEAVKTMQKMLIAVGVSCGSSGADGSFGNDTVKAVKAYQKKKGLVVDGYYGEKTKAALTADYAKTKTTTSYKVKITADELNVRAGAGTNYKVNCVVKKNEVYTITSEKMNGSTKWLKLKSGAGWISSKYTAKV